METKYEAIFVIVNSGFSGTVMDAALAAGARGGTLMRAHGSANAEAEEFFGIRIEPEKEIVIILVPENMRDKVLTAIYKDAGLATAGSGIAFSLPVSQTAGLNKPSVTKQ